MKDGFNDFGGFGSDSSSTSSSGSRSTRDYTALPDWAANYIIGGIKHDGQRFNVALFAADGPEVPEVAREKFGVPSDVETVSVEEFFPQDFDCEGVGDSLTVSYEQLENSVEAGYISQEELDSMDIEPGDTTQWAYEGAESSPQSTLRDVFVGYHADKIVENFGSDTTVRVGSPKLTHSHIDAAHERFTVIRFLVSDSNKAPYNRVSARHNVGEITTSEYEEWCTNNGFGDKL